jgi:hypothetical protein
LEVSSFQNYRSPAAYYTGGSYPQRSYFLYHATITNATQEVKLYLENATLTKVTQVSLKDETGQGVPGVYLYFNKYYPGEALYRTVAMILTDDFGLGNSYLIPNDAWFRIVASQAGVTARTFNPQTIGCSPAAGSCELALSLAPSNFVEFTEYWGKFAYSCAYSNSTNVTSCTFADTSGLMKYARLRVWKLSPFSNTQLCDTNLTAASGTLTCTLTNPSGQYDYAFSAHFSDELLLDSGSFSANASALFGAEGLIVTLLFFLTCAFAGAFNPGYSVVLGFIGLLAAFGLGAFSIPFAAVVAVGVVAGVFMYKMRGAR